MDCQLSFNECLTSRKSIVLSKVPNSEKFTKKKICESQKQCGSGKTCSQTLSKIKKSENYKNIARGTKIDGRTKSRSKKGSLCKYIDQPTIYFLRLDPTQDKSKALSSMDSFETNLKAVCKSFQIRTPLFESYTKLMRIFKDIPTQTVGLLIIITHGSEISITVGGRIRRIKIGTGHFQQFAKQVKRILMKNAHILLVACSTGKVTTEPPDDGDLIVFTNTNHNNFANQLANATGHTVFATPGPQSSNEIMVARAFVGEFCGELFNSPVNYTYNSRKQKMYKFIPQT